MNGMLLSREIERWRFYFENWRGISLLVDLKVANDTHMHRGHLSVEGLTRLRVYKFMVILELQVPIFVRKFSFL